MKHNPIDPQATLLQKRMVYKEASGKRDIRGFWSVVIGLFFIFIASIFVLVEINTAGAPRNWETPIIPLFLLLPLGAYLIWGGASFNKLHPIRAKGNAQANRLHALKTARKLKWEICENREDHILAIPNSPLFFEEKQFTILFEGDNVWVNVSQIGPEVWRRYINPPNPIYNGRILRKFQRVWES